MKKIIPWLRYLTIVSIVVYLAIMYISLGRNYLFDWDEGIYATIGREMHQSMDILTPTWDGDLWLEKPPAIAWVTSLGISFAGENELGARLFMPIFTALTLYAIFRVGEYLGGTLMGSASSAMLAYFNLFLSRAVTVNTDGMLLAAIAWVCWLLLDGSSPWIVGLVMGLAIMVKGPAGILAILIALPLLIHKPKSFLLSSGLWLLIATLPWHLYALLHHGTAFTTPYILEQVVRRATVPIEFHMESRWFYFNFLYTDLGLGVVIVMLVGYALMIKKWITTRKLDNLALILWWLLLPLSLFTIAKTRLSWYILPVYPAIALSIGYGISFWDKNKRSRILTSVLILGMLLQMLWHGYRYVEPLRQTKALPDLLQVSQALSHYNGDTLSMLVSPNERVAEAILPTEQTISSSFRYGGSPSVVWYSRKHVVYYYNYDHFIDAANDPQNTLLIVTTDDQSKVPNTYAQVISSGRYLGFVKGAPNAQR